MLKRTILGISLLLLTGGVASAQEVRSRTQSEILTHSGPVVGNPATTPAESVRAAGTDNRDTIAPNADRRNKEDILTGQDPAWLAKYKVGFADHVPR